MQIYKETQEELTSELSDFKEKYREVVDLLRDTQNELKAAKKKSYPGMGEHKVSGMFDANSTKESKTPGKKHHFLYFVINLISDRFENLWRQYFAYTLVQHIYESKNYLASFWLI